MNSPKLVQQLEIFFQVCAQTESFQKFPQIYKYICNNELLPLLETIEKIRTDPSDPTEALKTLQIPEAQIEIVKNIVFKTVEAACLGLISKSKQKPEFEKALNYIIGIIEAGNYWSVVAHSMAEFEIQCDDKTVNRTFFEQKMLELV
jgi:hypothetical protein